MNNETVCYITSLWCIWTVQYRLIWWDATRIFIRTILLERGSNFPQTRQYWAVKYSKCRDRSNFQCDLFGLRVTDWENQTEVGTWGSADFPHISVGGHPWLTSNHGNICFLIALITFRLHHPPEIPNFTRLNSWVLGEFNKLIPSDSLKQITNIFPKHNIHLGYCMHKRTSGYCFSVKICMQK